MKELKSGEIVLCKNGGVSRLAMIQCIDHEDKEIHFRIEGNVGQDTISFDERHTLFAVGDKILIKTSETAAKENNFNPNRMYTYVGYGPWNEKHHYYVKDGQGKNKCVYDIKHPEEDFIKIIVGDEVKYTFPKGTELNIEYNNSGNGFEIIKTGAGDEAKFRFFP